MGTPPPSTREKALRAQRPKTISAYDVAVSDAIHDPSPRYVSRQRLQAMLDHAWGLLQQRLNSKRAGVTTCFVFADTVAAQSFTRREEGYGWLGIRFQAEPRGEPSDIIIHARMRDPDNAHEQEALGILGGNLIHAAFQDFRRPAELIASLMDGLTRGRMEVDMIRFSGSAFTGVDNRLMSLQLVQQRLANAVLFAPDAEVVEPAELLYERPILIVRGSPRPVTNITMDMRERSLDRMRQASDMAGKDSVVLMEMTLRNLRALGETVMIFNYTRFHNVTNYLRRYTRERIVMALGVPTLALLFEEKHYRDLERGLLGALGQLLTGPVTLSVYPWRNARTCELVTAETFTAPAHLCHPYDHLIENGYIEPIRELTAADLSLLPRDILALLRAGDPAWGKLIPLKAARVIKKGRLFGYRKTHCRFGAAGWSMGAYERD